MPECSVSIYCSVHNQQWEFRYFKRLWVTVVISWPPDTISVWNQYGSEEKYNFCVSFYNNC